MRRTTRGQSAVAVFTQDSEVITCDPHRSVVGRFPSQMPTLLAHATRSIKESLSANDSSSVLGGPLVRKESVRPKRTRVELFDGAIGYRFRRESDIGFRRQMQLGVATAHSPPRGKVAPKNSFVASILTHTDAPKLKLRNLAHPCAPESVCARECSFRSPSKESDHDTRFLPQTPKKSC